MLRNGEEERAGETPAGSASIEDTAAVARLSRDYGEIASLMAQLDEQVGSFTENMSKLNESAPKHAGLSALWEEQADAIKQELQQRSDPGHLQKKSNSKPAKSKQPTSPKRRGRHRKEAEEKANDKNDPLVFV